MNNFWMNLCSKMTAIFRWSGIYFLTHKYRKDGKTIIVTSKTAVITSICVSSLIFYCIVINFDRHIPGPTSFIRTDESHTIARFMRLLSHAKAIVIFIPLWLYYCHNKKSSEYFSQVYSLILQINGKFDSDVSIFKPIVIRTALLMFFMFIYGILQLTYMFAKFTTFDSTWMDWSMIICMIAPHAYALLCIARIFMSLTVTLEYMKQITEILEKYF